MTTIPFEFSLSNTNPDATLGLELRLDGEVIYRNEHVSTPERLKKFISDDDGEHVLEIEMFGKKPEHTKVDEAGNITDDSVLELFDMKIDDIDIKNIVYENAVYTHDFNGTKEKTDTKFYGTLGCNGIVRLEFTTPIYIWFLEKM
jgi:hypothetical protein